MQVRSLALHKGVFLRSREELLEAEQLRQACHEALCRTSSRSKDFPDARKQILYGYGDLRQYCSELARPQFWGGEVEMMVISKMLKIPIVVYTADESKQQYDLVLSEVLACCVVQALCCGTYPVIRCCLRFRWGQHVALIFSHSGPFRGRKRPHKICPYFNFLKCSGL